jgi:hypothetical protein
VEHIGKNLPSMTSWEGSTQISTGPLAEDPARIKAGRDAAQKIFQSYPDYGRLTDEFVQSFIKAMTVLNGEELALVLNPRTGIVARCKFMPTIAEVHELLREERAKADQFKSHPTSGYSKLPTADDEPDPRPSAAARAKQVRDLLGYNPLDRHARRDPPAFKTKPLSEFRSSADCSRQDDGPSDELLDLVDRQMSGEEPRWS